MGMHRWPDTQGIISPGGGVVGIVAYITVSIVWIKPIIVKHALVGNCCYITGIIMVGTVGSNGQSAGSDGHSVGNLCTTIEHSGTVWNLVRSWEERLNGSGQLGSEDGTGQSRNRWRTSLGTWEIKARCMVAEQGCNPRVHLWRRGKPPGMLGHP